jgi:hypothetical protein
MDRTGSGRFEGDTWDLASSVGATATGVAASRALASKQPNPLINDPFADALVKAVGLEDLNRLADGEFDDADDPLLNCQQMCEQIAVRTRFFDDFFIGAVSAPNPLSTVGRCPSTSATTGRRRCATMDSIPPSPPPGSRRDC